MQFTPSIIFTVFVTTLAASTAVFAGDAENLPRGKAVNREVAKQCLHDLQAFDAKLAHMGFGLAPARISDHTPPQNVYSQGIEDTPRQKIRGLRDTALAYAIDGDEMTCQVVLKSMRDIFDEHQKVVGLEADDPLARSAWRRAHLSRAEPIAQMDHLARADILIGSDIRNLKDEKLGEIEDIVFNPRKQAILYVLVSRGGVLGFGKKLSAVRWRDLRTTQDHELYLLDVSVETFKNAPKVERRNFQKTANAAWQRSLAVYWDGHLKP